MDASLPLADARIVAGLVMMKLCPPHPEGNREAQGKECGFAPLEGNSGQWPAYGGESDETAYDAGRLIHAVQP